MPSGNKDIAKYGEGTRFGEGGRDPNEPKQNPENNKPWSIRNSIRYLAAQEIDCSTPETLAKTMAKTINPKRMTLAQLIALRLLEKASKGDTTTMGMAIDNIDGKLVETVKTVDNDQPIDEEAEDPTAAYTQNVNK